MQENHAFYPLLKDTSESNMTHSSGYESSEHDDDSRSFPRMDESFLSDDIKDISPIRPFSQDPFPSKDEVIHKEDQDRISLLGGEKIGKFFGEDDQPLQLNSCQCFMIAPNTCFPVISEFLDVENPLMHWVKQTASHYGDDEPKQILFKSSDEMIEQLIEIIIGFPRGEANHYQYHPSQDWKVVILEMMDYLYKIKNCFPSSYNQKDIRIALQSPSNSMNISNGSSVSFSLKSQNVDEESDVSDFLDQSFHSDFEKFSSKEFIKDKRAENLEDLYKAVKESRNPSEPFHFCVTNWAKEMYHEDRTDLLASFLKYRIEQGDSIEPNFDCLYDFRNCWKRRNLSISSENHLEVISLQWITGMLSDFGLNIKKNCKVILSEGVIDENSKYCKPDVCVEDKAICMEYKLENVLGCTSDIRKVTMLPIKFMIGNNLDHGMGLLADRKYAYMFFVEKKRLTTFMWTYCHKFDLEELSDRCLLFVVLMTWLVDQCKGNGSAAKYWMKLNSLAQKWKEERDKKELFNKKGDLSDNIQDTTSKHVHQLSSSNSSRNSMNTPSNSQKQQKLIQLNLKKQVQERSKKILNDVSHFARNTVY
nr:unnamed protein product [Naegleria fowleri]